MLNQKNSKKQGDVGLGAAIAYFTITGYCVSIPLTDSQDYDLIVDIDDKLCRIQVKTTRFKNPAGYYQANLKVFGGNKSGQTIKNFDNSRVEYVFIITNDNVKYLIPSKDIIQKAALNLNKNYDKYII